ncbi:hypothetical protein EJ110_NYTH37134 [Nymphaea thermarum]|nr:hypothetical protein EJ110_NYTH37134 [Nymphaea thermarum]
MAASIPFPFSIEDHQRKNSSKHGSIFTTTIPSSPPPPSYASLAITFLRHLLLQWRNCYGQLICISGCCTDDPDVGTHICSSGTSSPSGTCSRSGTLTCVGRAYPTCTCSPPVSSSTATLLTLNDFNEGRDGGGSSECDNSYHANSERVVALSTGWYAGAGR